MSIKCLSWVWENGPLNHTQRLVLLALADFCNDDFECFPSIRRIAEKSAMSERGVQKVIRALVAGGWLAIDEAAARHRCNLYRVLAGKQIAAAPPNDVQGAPRSPRTTFTPNGVHPKAEESVNMEVGPPNGVQGEPGSGRTARYDEGEHGAPKPFLTVITTTLQSREPADEPRPAEPVSPTKRERLRAAMGADPISGLAGVSGQWLGTATDMVEAAKWDALGLTIDEQVAVIADVCARKRAKNPNWVVNRFTFFNGAMSDHAAAKASGLPARSPNSKPSDDEATMIARFKRLAQAPVGGAGGSA